MSDAIQTKNLCRSYDGRPVVRDLNLHVPKGCVYGLLGRNGAGKSTTIRMLMGLLQPDSGDASLLGVPLSEITPEHRAKIAYIAENHPLYRWMTVRDSVQFARSFYGKWNQNLVDTVLDHFEISRQRKLNQLSNGQQAQVSLAIALAPEPELLILDDPTLGLDTVVRRDFLESMIEVIHQSGRTILISSHILADIDRIADRVGIMVNGRLVVDCPTEHFRDAVRRLTLRFSGPVPACPPVPGLVSSRVVRNHLEVVLVNESDEARRMLEALQPVDVMEVELNLEDAFIEYTRGSKKGLPTFSLEPADA